MCETLRPECWLTGITPTQRKENNTHLTIYANPSTGKCNFIIPEKFSKVKNLTLRIFDNAGKLIQQQNVVFEEEKVKINSGVEAKGIYNVTLSNGKKSYNGKIVFE